MKEYTVNTYKKIDWNDVPKAEISTYKWLDNGYEPVCYAQCAFLENDGLYIRMVANESNPRTEMKNFDDAVCTESCMEFFVSFDPENKTYVNFEVNAIGTLLATRRTVGAERVTIDKLIGIPEITAKIEDDFWSVEYMLTFDQIKKLFPNADLNKGSTFRANFYKCGDSTEIPHYGMWNEVESEEPSYHLPQYFGRLIIN